MKIAIIFPHTLILCFPSHFCVDFGMYVEVIIFFWKIYLVCKHYIEYWVSGTFSCHVFSPNMPMVQMVRKFCFGIWLQHIIPVVEKVSGRPFCAILPNASEQDRSYYKLYAFILQLSLLYCGTCNNYICSYFCNFGNCHYEASLLICSII